MIYLESTTVKLQAVLAGAVAANQPEVSVFFFDQIPQATTTIHRGAPQYSNLNSTTDADICDAPAAHGIIRNIHTIFVHNKDTAAVTVTVKRDDAGTESIYIKQALQAGESLTYEDGAGWSITSPFSLPVSDTTEIVKGSADATKRIRFEVDGLTTGTARTLTVPDADLTIVGTATTQTLTNKTHTNPANTDQTLTDGATINWDMSAGGIASVTLGGNRTMAAPTNLKKGTYILHVIQDGTGSRTISWNSVFKWPSATAPTLTTTAGARDILVFVCDGTNLYGPPSPWLALG